MLITTSSLFPATKPALSLLIHHLIYQHQCWCSTQPILEASLNAQFLPYIRQLCSCYVPPSRQWHHQCMTCSQSCSDSQSKMSRQRLSGFFVTATVKQTLGECHLPPLHAATQDISHWPPLVWMQGIIYHPGCCYLAGFLLTCSNCDPVNPQTKDCTAQNVHLNEIFSLVLLVSI